MRTQYIILFVKYPSNFKLCLHQIQNALKNSTTNHSKMKHNVLRRMHCKVRRDLSWCLCYTMNGVEILLKSQLKIFNSFYFIIIFQYFTVLAIVLKIMKAQTYNTVNSRFKKVHSFLKLRIVRFKKDLFSESKNRSSEKNALFKRI